MLKTDLEVAEILGSGFFKGEEPVVKRRVRNFLKKKKIEPVEKYEESWLYFESDIYGINLWHSKSEKGKDRRTTKSTARSKDMDAYEKARALLS